MNDIDPKSERPESEQKPGDEQRATQAGEAGSDAKNVNPPAAVPPAVEPPLAPTPSAGLEMPRAEPVAEPAPSEAKAENPAPEIARVTVERTAGPGAEPQMEQPGAASQSAPPLDESAQTAGSAPQVPPVRSAAGASSGQGPIIIPVSAKEALRPTPVPAPPPKVRKSRGSRSQVVVFLNFVMTILVFLSIALAGAIYYGLSTYSDKGPSTVNSNFIVKPGWGLGDISRGLEASGLISDARVFQYVTKTYLRNRTLKAGEYEIKAGASMMEIVELMESGKSILYSVTLPEGLTVQQIFDRLRADPVLEGDLPGKLPDEGTLRPDTYKFTRGAKRSEIVAQMKAAQSRLVDDLWSRRAPDLLLKTKEEFLTLASIVEKETGKADERTLVASVFINRLEKKMRLQSDPTVIYGIFGGAGKPSDRPIYQSDLKKMTPYNTYVVDGLPPGPICNPGRAALEAVANPSKTKDLYFVADGTGGHVFAATLDEHNANVRRWRQLEDQQANPTGTDVGATAPEPATQQ